MGTITKNLGELQTGMVLGADAASARGQMLLGAGTILTARHLQLLAANGVERLEIEAPGQAPGQPPPAADPAQLEARLATRFAHNDLAHPLIRELERICRNRNEGGEMDGD